MLGLLALFKDFSQYSCILFSAGLLLPFPSQVLLGLDWNQMKSVWTNIERIYILRYRVILGQEQAVSFLLFLFLRASLCFPELDLHFQFGMILIFHLVTIKKSLFSSYYIVTNRGFWTLWSTEIDKKLAEKFRHGFTGTQTVAHRSENRELLPWLASQGWGSRPLKGSEGEDVASLPRPSPPGAESRDPGSALRLPLAPQKWQLACDLFVSCS